MGKPVAVTTWPRMKQNLSIGMPSELNRPRCNPTYSATATDRLGADAVTPLLGTTRSAQVESDAGQRDVVATAQLGVAQC